MQDNSLRRLAYCCGISGAAALLHELVWTRRLEALVGGSTQTAGLVLAMTLAGMALGAWFSGSHPRPRLSGAREYALWESLVAVHGALLPLGLWLLASLPFGQGWAHFETEQTLRTVLGCLLLLPGAFALGASFPPLLRHASTKNQAGDLAHLYGWNTLGASLGVLAGGFVLLPRFGTAGTHALAVLASLLAAFLAPSISAPEISEPCTASRRPPQRRIPWSSLALYGFFGLTTLSLEVLFHRLAGLWMGGSSYAFTSVLALFLVGMALGSALVSQLAPRPRRANLALGFTRFLVALWLVAFLWIARDLPLTMARVLPYGGGDFAWLLGSQVLGLAALLLPGSLLLGAGLPLLVAGLETRSTRELSAWTGKLYAANALGCVLGALGTSHVLLPCFGLRASFVGLLGLEFGIALVLLLPRVRREVLPAVFLLTFLALGTLPSWDLSMVTSAPYVYAQGYQEAEGQGAKLEELVHQGTLLFQRDGAYASTSVREFSGGSRVLQINGKTDASTHLDRFTQEALAVLPGLLHPEAKEALVVGLGSGLTAKSFLDLSVERVDVLEIAPEVVEAASKLYPDQELPWEDQRCRLIVEDARSWIRFSGESYDVIASEPSNPWVAGMAPLFTREYFERARNALKPGGLMVQWIQGYQIEPEDFASVVASFREVFPQALLFTGRFRTDFLLVGRKGEHPGRIQIDQAFEGKTPFPGWDRETFLTAFQGGPKTLAKLSAGAKILTEDDPALEFSAPRGLVRDQIDAVRDLVQEAFVPEDRTWIGASLEDLARREASLSLQGQLRELERAVDALDWARARKELAALPQKVRSQPALEDLVARMEWAEVEALAESKSPRIQAALEAFVEAHPTHQLGRYQRGVQRARSGKLAEALEDFEALYHGGYRGRVFLTQLSQLYHRQKRYPEASRTFLESLAETRPSAEEWKILGELFKDQGDLKRAAFAWKKSLDQDPNQPELTELFQLYMRVTDGDIAAGLAEE